LDGYEYAAAKSELESFFWQELADNYLEMCKQRLYDKGHPLREGACFTLYHVLLTVIQLFAPYLPFVTEEIYLGLFVRDSMPASIHVSLWPNADPALDDETSELTGARLVEIATAVRRYKSERNLPLGTELARLELAFTDESKSPAGYDLQGREIEDGDTGPILQYIEADLKSITRAKSIEIVEKLDRPSIRILSTSTIQAGIIQ
jgi:valyl-tRNA synthetase